MPAKISWIMIQSTYPNAFLKSNENTKETKAFVFSKILQTLNISAIKNEELPRDKIFAFFNNVHSSQKEERNESPALNTNFDVKA